MKMVVAVIRPFALDAVIEALSRLGVRTLTVCEVKTFDRRQAHIEIYRGAEYAVCLLPRIRIEVGIADNLAERVIETIQRVADMGRMADGEIFVTDILAALPIRTGETEAA